ncbi:MAG: lipopolysaccharide heptosyltransferase II [Parachlamydiales bacterium]|nr:lipopolysaccharide heptosyltransferase II [Parachlamydiales bacterium]
MVIKNNFNNIEKIIVRMPNWMGDCVMGLPVLQDLKNCFPQSNITAMISKPLAPLLENNPYIESTYTFSRPTNRAEQKKIINDLYQNHYDLGILLPNSFSSARLFYKAKVQNRLGYKGNLRSIFLTYPVKCIDDENTHLVVTYKKILEPLGIRLSSTKPTLYISDSEKTESIQFLKNNDIDQEIILIGINPGAAFGPAKCWLPERYRQVASQLLENPKVRLLFFGDKHTTPLSSSISEKLPHSRCLDLSGKTSIRQFIALMDQCHVILTNDSGPMHVAAALQKPMVALFGSTNDVATGPYSDATVIHKHVECSPCYRKVCPIDFRCMKRIEVQEVYKALCQYINSVGVN